jgi:predicted ATPase/DNA-binding CsgD family transcriptional regulator
LIGRSLEQRNVHELLAGSNVRLVTLCGPGGIGKTRLALEIARKLEAHFADGARFVNLTAYREAGPVLSAMAAAIRPGSPAKRPSVAALARWLQPLHILLVLDNFEQVQDAAPLVAELVAACPRLTVLVTSRAPLHLTWEHIITVGPLPASAAVALFLERSAAAGQDTNRTEKDLTSVTQICRRLDGIPLAIELAATRTRELSTVSLLTRLDRMFDVLTVGPRDGPPRHETLRSAFDWSYDLLTEFDRQTFRNLGVFVGGCSLEAAARICGARTPPDHRFIDAVGRLVDSGLINSATDAETSESRLQLLEPLREYAVEKLRVANEYEVVANRHANFYLDLAELVEPEIRGPRQATSLALLNREHANLLAALRWFTGCGVAESSLRMASALGLFWWASGYTRDGLEWLQFVLAMPGAESTDAAMTFARANALAAAGSLLFWHADVQASEVYNRRALALYDANSDPRRRAHALNELGNCAASSGELDRAEALYLRARELYAAAGDDRGVAQSVMDVGLIAFYRGKYAQAEELLTQSVSAVSAAGDTRGVSMAFRCLAMAQCYRDDFAAARASVRAGLLLSTDVRDRAFIPILLEAAGIIAIATGDCIRGLRLGAAAATLRDDMDMPIRPVWKRELMSSLERARTAIGPEKSAEAWAQGLTLGVSAAIAEAASTDDSTGADVADVRGPARLTHRETEVLRLLASGHTNKEIAGAIGLSIATVERHVANMYGKIHARGRAEATAFAITRGLFAPRFRFDE